VTKTEDTVPQLLRFPFFFDLVKRSSRQASIRALTHREVKGGLL
jgi:hypothetical protein